jgi:hypothetical protein
MRIIVHPHFSRFQPELINFITHFSSDGLQFGNGNRNKIRLFDLNGKTVNIKSFKIPNLFNQVIYKFFRKSKARRSYEFANRLLEYEIGTPQPIAFCENASFMGIQKSFYISEHLQADLTFRELVEIPSYPDHENILRQFVQFSFRLHEKGVEFLDHSPGNTLIKKTTEGKYDFFLVDLNRMNFEVKMDLNSRMKNLSRLTPKMEMIVIMSDEYAKLYNKSFDDIHTSLRFHTEKFQAKYHFKQKLKNQFKLRK